MIVTTVRHGRTARDTRYLLAHLSKEQGQRSRVVHVAAPTATAPEALAYMSALRDGSRATVAYHHVSLNPSAPLTNEQRDEAVARVLSALGAEDHAHVVWEHAGKARRGGDVDTHYHVVVGHVGPDGKALEDRRSYARLEAAARSLELDFGHDLTLSRHTAAVAAELDRIGRPDVAAKVRNEGPPEPPQSAMSSRQRSRADRTGVSLPDVREAVREAWTISDTPAALRAALADAGLGITPGDKSGVWLVTRDSQTLGALDRLAGEKRRVVATRMQQEEPPNDSANPASDASFEGNLHRGPRESAGRRGPGPAPRSPRRGGARRGITAGGSDGASTDHPPDAASDTPGDRGIGRSPRRTEAALATLTLVRAAQAPAVQTATKSLRHRVRPRGRAVLDARRLARVNLDEFRRMAEELARRAVALLTWFTRPTDPRDELSARLRAANASVGEGRRTSTSIQDREQEAPTPAYRPRF